MDCILNISEDNRVPKIDAIVQENFFGETYESPEKTPSYVSTYIDDDKGLTIREVVRKLGKKILDIGGDFSSYIKGFENLRFEREGPNVNSSKYSVISGYEGNQEKFLLVGDIEGERTVIGALPPENTDYPNTLSLIAEIRNKLSKGLSTNINTKKLAHLINGTYQTRIKNANPLLLSKYIKPGENSVQTLANLRDLYGDSYQDIFSSPYIVTGKFNLQEDYAGRTIIVYNKFPERGVTVDSIISKYGFSRSVKDRMLGIIPLNNSVYTNLDDLLADVKTYIGEDLSKMDVPNNVKMFVSSPSLNKFAEELYSILAKTNINTSLHKNLKNALTRMSIGWNKDTVTFESFSATPRNFVQYLLDLKNTGDPFYSELNNLFQESIKGGFPGIFINPILLKHNTDISINLARVDESLGNSMNDKLLVKSLSMNVVQPPRMEFLIQNPTVDITDLFSTTYAPEIGKVTPTKRFTYTKEIPKKVGRELDPNTAKLLETFEAYGITSNDMDQWVKSLTSKVLLNSDNSNFTESLDEVLQKLTENNGDCI